jgi:hypothetical protein
MKMAGITDRRQSRRFKVSWQVVVTGYQGADGFEAVGSLGNLSSGGAFFYLDRSIPVGAHLDVMIRVPLKRENWMRYSAEVVRTEPGVARVGLAARFESLIPAFSPHTRN